MDSSWLPFLIIFITGSCFGMESPSPCPQNQFLHPNGICCEFCGLGTYVFKPCLDAGSNPLCFVCEMGTSYMDKPNKETMCKQCRVCDPESEVEDKECTFVYNRQCVCRDGFRRKGNKCMMDNTVEDKTDVRSAALFKHPMSTSTVFLPWWIWLPLPIGSILFALFMFLLAVEANAEFERKEEKISAAVTQIELEECVLDTKSRSVASVVEIHQAPRPT